MILNAIKWRAGFLIGFFFLGFGFTIEAEAQAPPPITSSGLNTQVSGPINLPSGETQYNITGGIRPENGPNLFQSFGEFGLPENNIANFLNDTGLPTENILGRVTGGNPSNIFGTIQTEGFPAASLFLMNPAGWVFGPNAALNVEGSVNFTTADYLRHSDGSLFMALSPEQDSQLSIAPIAAFGFLGSDPAGIIVQGSTLTVEQGHSISLVSGEISIESFTDVPEGDNPKRSTINAPSGEIRFASVASAGEVSHPDLSMMSNINGEVFSDLGTIALSEETLVNVSGDASGTVSIRGGELVMTNATISADTVNQDGAPVAIDIDVAGDVSISLSNTNVPALTARTTGSGNAGEIRIASGTMNASASALPQFTVPIIDSHTSGPGNAGKVSIDTGDLNVTGDLVNFNQAFFVNSGTDGANVGRGGDVSIIAEDLQAFFTSLISTGNFFFRFNIGEGATAGNVSILADSIDFSFTDINTDAFDFSTATGKAGNVGISANEINFSNSSISSAGQERGGSIAINTNSMAVSGFSQITTLTNSENGGGITIEGKQLEFINGGSVVSTTQGNGNAGDITIKASERLSLLNDDSVNVFGPPSGINSNSNALIGEAIFGNAGNIFIETPILEMTGGSRINTSTDSSGAGGDVTIHAQEISMSGETTIFFPDEVLNFGEFAPSGIFTQTIGGGCEGPCGDAGNVTVNTISLVMEKGAQISSGTGTEGRGGDITINASEMISTSGTLMDGRPGGIFSRTIGESQGAGMGGNISVTSDGAVSISDGASVSADSTGLGNSGTVKIAANQTVQIVNGTISTSANQGEGGDIVVTAGQDVELMNEATVLAESSGAGDSGSVTLEAQNGNFKSNNSTVSTTAQQATGGAIRISAGQNVELMNDSTVLAESLGPGNSGKVTLEAKNGSFQSNNSTVSTSAQQGEGGAIVVSAGQNVELMNESTVLAESFGAGNSGNVTLSAKNGTFTSDDSTVSTTAQQAQGGGIAISAGQDVNLTNKATVSARSFGPGNAGDVTLTSGHDINMTNSTISTEAAQASGGNVKLSAPNIIQLTDSRIESSVVGGQATEGGNIDLDPEFIILTNSQILAKATAGNGGNITLTATGAVFIDANSVLDASSETGISGNVTVNSPIVALAEVVAALPKNFVIPQSLFADACAAQAGGQFSSFTQGAPAALPPAPGGFLSSPLMLNNLSTPPSTGGMTQGSTLAQSRLGLDFSTIPLLPAFGCGA